ncbi:transcription factor bHLH18-like [Lolium rigidum]|uniref:transcription factor bHLH18-like n=1 Tax=Lolium rigidum TaxID=89674 RepID=UPI001F5C3C1F|nr:transcription factor bHLH18-like [Lolium rigidum]
MDDSALFMQWAMETLEHEQPAGVVNGHPGEVAFPSLQALRDVSHATLVFDELIMDMEAHAANSGSSGETTDGSGGGNFSSTAPRHHDVSTSFRCAPNHGNNSGPTNMAVMSWNFSAASAQPGSDGTLEGATAVGIPYERAMPDMAHVSQPTRRTSTKSNAGGSGTASAPFVVDHIMAERKRREKINQRFIELSTVIPGLKKMDKATILSDATRHVKQLQEKIKAFEATGGGSNGRSVVETVVLVKKPCYAAVGDENGSPSSASSGAPAVRDPLPEIEVRFSENGVMVRIVCDDAKGVVVKVLSEAEEGLHLSITHANVMAFTACTVIITITAKVEEGFTVTAEDIIGRLNSVLQ